MHSHVFHDKTYFFIVVLICNQPSSFSLEFSYQ